MCGIAGVMVRKGETPSLDVLDAMKRSLKHRGPDDDESLILNNVGLAHTRLSIIDLGTGHQPLRDHKGRLLIVNGEIYNYLELKQQFPDYPFKTQSDSEVVFPLYERYGLDFARHLRGMFAIALYDTESDQVLLSRDPYGIKQFYLLKKHNLVAFASEPRAFFDAGLIPAEVNPDIVSEALQLRYTLLEPTIFRDVERIPLGATLVLKGGAVVDQVRFEALESNDERKQCWSLSEEEAIKNFDAAIRDSVHVHLRSDVPYGLFLSGGLDSATVLAKMAEFTDQPIKTYTIGFPGTKVHDERSQAQILAHRFNTDHHDITFNEQDFWTLLPQVAFAVDDLQIDMASLPTFKLAIEAKKDVKVVLCGEGGDEMLAGYGRYRKTWLPTWLGGRVTRERGTMDKVKLGHRFDSQWKDRLKMLEETFDTMGFSRMQIAQAVDVKTWLANSLLIKLDRCLMAHGLEGRTPFLDPRVTDHTFFLNDRLKVKKGQGKYVQRAWLAKNLPEAEPFAKKKGFTVPVGEWMRQKNARLSALVGADAGVRELFSQDEVRGLFMSNEKHHAFAAWTLLFYAVWHKAHIERKPIIPDTLAFLAS